MVQRSWVFVGVFSAALALNPGYLTGCASGSDESSFSYDEHDMAEVVAELQEAGALSFEADGARYVVHVRAPIDEQEARRTVPAAPLFAAVAHACGTRQFLLARPASACIDASELQFEAKLIVTRSDRVSFANGETVQGQFWVPSLHLSGGEFTLQTPRVSVRIQAQEHEDGFTFQVTSLNILE